MDNNFDDLFNLDEINEALHEKFRDPNIKEIGDRVAVIDYSSVTRIDGSEIDESDEDMQFNADMYFIVTQTHQRAIYDAYYTKYIQDLVIANPQTKMEYRVTSGHVTHY